MAKLPIKIPVAKPVEEVSEALARVAGSMGRYKRPPMKPEAIARVGLAMIPAGLALGGAGIGLGVQAYYAYRAIAEDFGWDPLDTPADKRTTWSGASMSNEVDQDPMGRMALKKTQDEEDARALVRALSVQQPEETKASEPPKRYPLVDSLRERLDALGNIPDDGDDILGQAIARQKSRQ